MRVVGNSIPFTHLRVMHPHAGPRYVQTSNCTSEGNDPRAGLLRNRGQIHRKKLRGLRECGEPDEIKKMPTLNNMT